MAYIVMAVLLRIVSCSMKEVDLVVQHKGLMWMAWVFPVWDIPGIWPRNSHFFPFIRGAFRASSDVFAPKPDLYLVQAFGSNCDHFRNASYDPTRRFFVVCQLFNGTSALFRLLAPRAVEQNAPGLVERLARISGAVSCLTNGRWSKVINLQWYCLSNNLVGGT